MRMNDSIHLTGLRRDQNHFSTLMFQALCLEAEEVRDSACPALVSQGERALPPYTSKSGGGAQAYTLGGAKSAQGEVGKGRLTGGWAVCC